MFNIKDVKQGLVVANFLRNTGRWFHAIKLCREFLFLLYTLEEEEQLDESLEKIVDDMCIWAAPYIFSPEIRRSVAYSKAATVCYHQCEYRTARELIEKAIAMDTKIGDKGREADGHGNVGVLFQCVGQFYEAIKHHEKALAIRIKIGDRNGAVTDIGNIGSAFLRVGKYGKAKEYFEKALAIGKEVNDKKGEARLCGNLGGLFCALGEYEKAETYLKKALAIREEIGYQDGEAMVYVGLGTVFLYLSEYVKAKRYIEKALAISMEIGDKKGVALSYENLGSVFLLSGDYAQAKIHLEKALDILIEIGDRHGEAHSYGNLGALFETICEYDKAKAYLQKALAVHKEIDDRRGEAMSLTNLGKTFCSTAEYTKAKQYHEKALMISMEIGDRAQEALCYGELGAVFQSLGEYVKAKEYYEKSLTISKKIGYRLGEAADYGNLGTLFLSLGKYIKAQEYQEKSLAISKKIGDRKGEAETYCNLGTMYESLGESVQAKEYHEKSLTITVEIGNRAGVANVYVNLGVVFQSFGEIKRAKECYEMALEIAKEIGDKKVEAVSNDNLGTIFLIFGELAKARTYYKKSLAIFKDIGNKAGEATSYGSLGMVCRLLGEYVMAEKYLKKALSIAKFMGYSKLEFGLYCGLALLKLLQKLFQAAFSYLLQGITKCEDLRHSLATNDQLSISFSDSHVFPYWLLSELFCAAGNSREALYVVELGRARALADLMATQYSIKMEITANPESWVGMENIMKKESNCSCLYISYNNQHVSFWILKTSGVFHFRRHRNQNLDEFLSKSFRNFGILSEKECEDRSIKDIQLNSKSSQKESPALRLVEDDNEESQEPEPSLSLYYKMLIAPVADFLEGREIIIVPDRSLCRVPFAALHDGSGKYLSETFWIRMVPSLTTLKLIQDSPADYHRQTGALIVGDPNVGQVLSVKGVLQNISRLPCARKEAEMIGRLLGVQPLLGEHATKEAVLQRINSVGLIHFAAHGNAERGEIALTPQGTSSGFPEEEDYLLTMSDISQVQLRAKLVVLSCCHSGNGQIRTEGVVGIARAFLGSGARSVLVALWAIDDIATEKFMRLFYKHLVRGESASECLHEAMKWMRGNGYSDVTQWAPFMLIGDNVTLKFGK